MTGYCRACGKKRALSKTGRCDSCIQLARIRGSQKGAAIIKDHNSDGHKRWKARKGIRNENQT